MPATAILTVPASAPRAVLLIFIGIVVIIVWKIVDPEGVEDAGLTVPDAVVDPLASDSSSSSSTEPVASTPSSAQASQSRLVYSPPPPPDSPGWSLG